ncbi:MAG: hypothetical protein ABG776_06025, partial [Cyanobacteria bacterium J06555_13]
TDEYAQQLDKLSVALETSYSQMKGLDSSIGKLEFSQAIVNRIRIFYCNQTRTKHFLDKRVAQAGADFFVETVLFFLKIFNEVEGLGFELSSERFIQRKRGSMRPDISIWNGSELIAIIECKTQLGWSPGTWDKGFKHREARLHKDFPEAKAFFLVLTGCNWGGFQSADPRVGEQLFCLLTEAWPAHLSEEFDPSIIQTPIEQLFQAIKNCPPAGI